ncbi:hypothetical protein TrVE_jg3327 [Triparma verrucosa]|uniref:Uncharacterized protein n=1 Tax=Triparma verrucosa TaxID=1606542 RepID=A0A9W7FFF9_9STRA|nr:hypothetical protein TrVE_jg3327 [Triparma verrucosa]
MPKKGNFFPNKNLLLRPSTKLAYCLTLNADMSTSSLDIVDPWKSPNSVVPVVSDISKIPSLPLLSPPAPKRYSGYSLTTDRSYLTRLGYTPSPVKKSLPSILDKRYTGYNLSTSRSYLSRLGYVASSTSR